MSASRSQGRIPLNFTAPAEGIEKTNEGKRSTRCTQNAKMTPHSVNPGCSHNEKVIFKGYQSRMDNAHVFRVNDIYNTGQRYGALGPQHFQFGARRGEAVQVEKEPFPNIGEKERNFLRIPNTVTALLLVPERLRVLNPVFFFSVVKICKH